MRTLPAVPRPFVHLSLRPREYLRALPRAALAFLASFGLGGMRAAEGFKASADHEAHPGVPAGRLIPMPPWESRIFPHTTRNWWIYVPAGYKPDGSAALMVFQDGAGYVNPRGNWRVPTVFDNLIASGAMPATVGVFLNPGNDPSKGAQKKGAQGNNRSLEYNSLGDRYARFLIEEILPEVEKQFPLSHDPDRRAIGGSSSGAIAAFTVAWERPDQFGKVFSTVGSFVNLAGGNAYPSLIRKTERKPLRVFLEDASGDLDNPFGNWPIANQQMHAALRYMGYDVRFDFAEGYGHNSEHGGSIFPEAMRWLWRKERPVPVIVTKDDLGGDMTLHRLLIEGEGWQPVVEGLGSADALCTDDAGNFYFSDLRGPSTGVFEISLAGARRRISPEASSGLKFGPDGRLYGCQGSKKRLIAISPDTGAVEVIASGVNPNDLVVTRRGRIYFTETAELRVMRIDLETRAVQVAATGIAGPNGITLSPDQGTLAVSEYRGGSVWTFRVNPDGSLDAGMPCMSMRRPIDPAGEFKFNEPPPLKASASGDGMTTDADGRFYVTTALGIQVFDPTGRLCGVLSKPQPGRSNVSCVLSGPGRSYLYVASGGAIFRRKVQASGNLVRILSSTPGGTSRVALSP